MNKQANRLKAAVEAKRQELIELFTSIGHEVLPCGTRVNSLTLTELQEMYRNGVRR